MEGFAAAPHGMDGARLYAGGFGAPLNHLMGIRLGQTFAGELAGASAIDLEQDRLRVVRESGAVDILMLSCAWPPCVICSTGW
jgi:hypothetical protein